MLNKIENQILALQINEFPCDQCFVKERIQSHGLRITVQPRSASLQLRENDPDSFWNDTRKYKGPRR